MNILSGWVRLMVGSSNRSVAEVLKTFRIMVEELRTIEDRERNEAEELFAESVRVTNEAVARLNHANEAFRVAGKIEELIA